MSRKRRLPAFTSYARVSSVSGVRRPSMTSPMHAVIGATNGMSVIVWCARKYQSGIVASTRLPSSAARRPNVFAAPL